MKDTVTMTIGTLARKTGVNVETVRYYERFGIIAEPPRSASGYRHYTDEVVTRIRFIRRAQQLGFSLKEIQELLTLRVDHNKNTSCREVKKRAEAKISDVEAKIYDLERLKQALVEISDKCTGSGPISNCPILALLEHHSQ